MDSGFLTFPGGVSQVLIDTTADASAKVVAIASQNVNVWVSYSSGWYINVSDSSFVGNVYYSIVSTVYCNVNCASDNYCEFGS